MLDALSRLRFYPEQSRKRTVRGLLTGVERMEAPDNCHRVWRKASNFGEGCHFRSTVGARPARFQNASSTWRFILKVRGDVAAGCAD